MSAYTGYDTWRGMDSEIAANMGTGDFLPPDPYDDDTDLIRPDEVFGAIYRRDLRTGILSLANLWDVKKAVAGTILAPWCWLGILAAGHIVETPTALYCTDSRRMLSPAILQPAKAAMARTLAAHFPDRFGDPTDDPEYHRGYASGRPAHLLEFDAEGYRA